MPAEAAGSQSPGGWITDQASILSPAGKAHGVSALVS